MTELPKCHHCDMDMAEIEGKHHAWQCSICQIKCRKVSNLQFHMERISLLDQLIAAEKRPMVKKTLEKRLVEAEAYKEHCDELKKAGVIFEDMEEYSKNDD